MKPSEPDYMDLVYRPIEHVLEDLSCRKLALALGCSRTQAAAIKVEPWKFVDTPWEMGDANIEKIRLWLRKRAKAGA